MIIALILSVFLLLNHVAALIATPFIFNAVFAKESEDLTITPGLVDYASVASEYARKEFTFLSEGTALQGYVYDNPLSQRLVIVSAGISSPADDYLAQETYFYDQGYDVISYDGYGKGKSGGQSKRGIAQAKKDLSALLSYLETSEYKEEPVFLFGHSQGAYASAAVLGENHPQIKAISAVSGFNSSEETVLEFARRKVSFLADLSWPYVTTYERYLFGADSSLKASNSLKNSAIPALICQGDADKTIPLSSLSLYRFKDSCARKDLSFSLFSGEHGGHTSILYSDEAVAYQNEVEASLSKLKERYPSGIPYTVKQDFYRGIDDERYSEVNPSLMEPIVALFNRC